MLATEAHEQETLVQWLRLKKIFHFAPVLENNTHGQNRKWAMIAEVKAKKQGKIKGTSDLFVFLGEKLLVIELKRAKKLLKSGKYTTSHTNTSKEQKAFLERVNKYPYAIGRVCFGWNEAKEFIENHL